MSLPVGYLYKDVFSSPSNYTCLCMCIMGCMHMSAGVPGGHRHQIPLVLMLWVDMKPPDMGAGS